MRNFDSIWSSYDKVLKDQDLKDLKNWNFNFKSSQILLFTSSFSLVNMIRTCANTTVFPHFTNFNGYHGSDVLLRPFNLSNKKSNIWSQLEFLFYLIRLILNQQCIT